MARIVVLGLPGETGLWIADLDTGTVAAMAPPETGALGAANVLRESGAAIVKGVDFAVAVASLEDAFSGKLEGFSGKLEAFSGKLEAFSGKLD
ncbi:hypothetical protein LXM94_11510 [Rhizobium sp. TRM95111]|uniref:hypothetical protein n=1 Tax=Rhizobium alarense TaxID=2846851 RepID=UPI001F3E6E7B|nr:hypothetical protein [Rhizobium alarense]MCF3640591.1 hypothetical protein [Rhizobium alarense]